MQLHLSIKGLKSRFGVSCLTSKFNLQPKMNILHEQIGSRLQDMTSYALVLVDQCEFMVK